MARSFKGDKKRQKHYRCIRFHGCVCQCHEHTPTRKCTHASMCAWCVSGHYKSAVLFKVFQGHQSLKTLVTDDICRDQTDSVLPPIPQIVWRAQGEYLHGWMSFPYKPLTLQPLSWSGCRLSIAFSGKGAALLSQYHPLCSLHLWNCKIQLWVN